MVTANRLLFACLLCALYCGGAVAATNVSLKGVEDVFQRAKNEHALGQRALDAQNAFLDHLQALSSSLNAAARGVADAAPVREKIQKDSLRVAAQTTRASVSAALTVVEAGLEVMDAVHAALESTGDAGRSVDGIAVNAPEFSAWARPLKRLNEEAKRLWEDVFQKVHSQLNAIPSLIVMTTQPYSATQSARHVAVSDPQYQLSTGAKKEEMVQGALSVAGLSTEQAKHQNDGHISAAQSLRNEIRAAMEASRGVAEKAAALSSAAGVPTEEHEEELRMESTARGPTEKHKDESRRESLTREEEAQKHREDNTNGRAWNATTPPTTTIIVTSTTTTTAKNDAQVVQRMERPLRCDGDFLTASVFAVPFVYLPLAFAVATMIAA